MSQNFDLGPSFYFMKKRVPFGVFFSSKISTFHKMKPRTNIKISETPFPPSESQKYIFKFERSI